MYSVLDYGHMAADEIRMDAYARAIARAVTPGSIVVDLGAGTGIFSLLAVQAGAKRVHAIDVDPALALLEDLARENGVADRIRVHAATSSFDVELPEKADVIVSDLRGSVPLFDDHCEAMKDALRRFLRPGGVLLPARDDLFVTAVESDALARDLERATGAFRRRGFSADAIATSITNDVYKDTTWSLSQADVRTTSARWATIEYARWDGGVVDGTVSLAVTRPGTLRALAVWFEATIFEGCGFSTAPGSDLRYRRLVLPLSEGVAVAAGDAVDVTLRADERGERWAWDTRVAGPNGVTKAAFRQSTFLGAPATAAALLRSSSGATPRRSPRGERLRRILEAMDGTNTVGEIAKAVADERVAPARALDEVRRAIMRYGC